MSTTKKPSRKRSTKQQAILTLSDLSNGGLGISLKFKPAANGVALMTPSVEAGKLCFEMLKGNKAALRTLLERISK